MTQQTKHEVHRLEDGSTIVDGMLFLSTAAKQRLVRENLRRLDAFRASLHANAARSERHQ